MIVPAELLEKQYSYYLPYLYNFYLEHTEKTFLEVVSVKWSKQPKSEKLKPTPLNFIIAGVTKVQHLTQQYSYTMQEYIVKSYDLIFSEVDSQNQKQSSNNMNLHPQITTLNPASIVQKNRIFYEKSISFVQDVKCSLKRSLDYETSRHFYAVAIKNDSIRLINASKMAGQFNMPRITFLTERSPFFKKNVNSINLCTGNQMQAGIIPLNKEVTVMKCYHQELRLLCGCSDGNVVIIDLNIQILSANEKKQHYATYFSAHTKAIKDVAWLPYSQKYDFASVAQDGTFFIWNKQNNKAPLLSIKEGSKLPTSLIQVYPDQLIIAGRDCSIKFIDLEKSNVYDYSENSEIVTKLFNLTGQINYSKNMQKISMDGSLRFISCEQSGRIVFWQGEKQFYHLPHKSRIAGIDFTNDYAGLFIAIQKQKAHLSIFSPIIASCCLDQNIL